ncbi:MAG: hypothetical protein WAV23_00595 [Minisyncoccia bacterium]
MRKKIIIAITACVAVAGLALLNVFNANANAGSGSAKTSHVKKPVQTGTGTGMIYRTNSVTYPLENGKLLTVKTTTPYIDVVLPAKDTFFVQRKETFKKVMANYTDCKGTPQEYEKTVVGPAQIKLVKLRLAGRTITVPLHKLEKKEYVTSDKPAQLCEATIVTLKYK